MRLLLVAGPEGEELDEASASLPGDSFLQNRDNSVRMDVHWDGDVGRLASLLVAKPILGERWTFTHSLTDIFVSAC